MHNISKEYSSLNQKYEEAFKQSSKQINLISSIRLGLGALILIFAYQYFQTTHTLFLIGVVSVLAAFIYLIKIHTRHFYRKKLNRALADINKDELEFVEHNKIPFDNGIHLNQPNHFYAQDLDIFGNYSLYQYLNRTSIKSGGQILGNYLLELPDAEEIEVRQEAVKELNPLLAWRQLFYASARITSEKKGLVENLLAWSKTKLEHPNRLVLILAYILPSFLFLCIGLSFFSTHTILPTLIKGLIIANLVLASSQTKILKNELIHSDGIKNTLKSYSLLLKQIESETFTSKKLLHLQNQLKKEGISASDSIKMLSSIYAELENVFNMFGFAIFNGLLVYHVHSLNKLKKWKEKHGNSIEQWLAIMGEFEAISSLANFSYNNPTYCFPELNTTETFHFDNLGHPLLKEKERINNDLKFDPFRFIILTGSNMSGKSTFLRSLGINMVLAQSGSVVCASKATLQPLPILVSMRVSDSLGEGESFFFAEVKRLKQIMDAAEKRMSFVLLDEILRGTNSDDKRTGTVEVIKKIIGKNAFGAIATHDLKVCDTTADYPKDLSNKCFEVEIENNELVFDYKLRDGVCKNKSATFLMKKMEVI